MENTCQIKGSVLRVGNTLLRFSKEYRDKHWVQCRHSTDPRSCHSAQVQEEEREAKVKVKENIKKLLKQRLEEEGKE